MSSRRAITLLIVICTLATVQPFGAPPAMASFESTDNNFFGTNPVSNTGTFNSFFGGSAGLQNTSGASNSFFGRSAGFANTTGNDNAFLGAFAGSSNTSGFDNAFFGRSTGAANTTGSLNAFFGTGAGENNTTGTNNTFVGRSAGLSNTGSNNNSFFGRDAGRDNTAGTGNAFFGLSAGTANTEASSNAFFGANAGEFSTGPANSFFGRFAGMNATGADNAFFGHCAGCSNTTGFDNAFFGRSAGLSNTEGIFNAFFGRNAGTNNTTGNENAFFGTFAGASNSTGFSNAFFGRSAGLSNTIEDFNSFLGAFSNGAAGIANATAVGNRAQVSQSNSLVLGSIAGLNNATENVRVGIGTAAPVSPLHVRRTDGTAKVLVEEASATTLGRSVVQLTNNGATRFRVQNTQNGATWDFQASGGGGSFVIDFVGGPASLDFEVQPDGDALHRGTVTATSFITLSDRTKKTDITPANASKLMAMLRELDISTWRFKSEPEGTVNLGPMAQDFHRLFGMGTETTIQIRDLAALALVAAQALDRQADDQQSEIATQQKENAGHRKAIAGQRKAITDQQSEIDELKQAVAALSSR